MEAGAFRRPHESVPAHRDTTAGTGAAERTVKREIRGGATFFKADGRLGSVSRKNHSPSPEFSLGIS